MPASAVSRPFAAASGSEASRAQAKQHLLTKSSASLQVFKVVPWHGFCMDLENWRRCMAKNSEIPGEQTFCQ